jgi:cadmium resistance protein CadD (predicted permease)
MGFLQVVLLKVLWDTHLMAQPQNHNLLGNFEKSFVGVAFIYQGLILISELEVLSLGK